jgi:hypothetical protein
MPEDEQQVPGRVAAEDYRRQRQEADHGRDDFAKEVRVRFDEFRSAGRDRLLEMARVYAIDDREAETLVDQLLHGVTTADISPIDEPYGHRIISDIVARIDEICARGGIPVREGVVVGVSPTEGLHAYQSEVPATGASIIDFALPFVIFCNEMAILIARTLPHLPSGTGQAVICDPARVRHVLATDEALSKAWGLLLARYAIEGWPLALPRLPIDVERVSTRLHILFSMELFAVAHEYGHHVLLHGVAESSSPMGDGAMMEHDADGFARMVSMAIGSSSEPPNPFAISGAGAALMLGALDLVRRAGHVLEAGNAEFPPREIHPPLHERVTHVGSFDRFAPEGVREQFAAMRGDLLGVVEAIWAAVEPMFLRMHHEGEVKLDSREKARVDWFSLI